MESWAGLNVSTPNTTVWVHLMNLTMAEWGLGQLPPKDIAITGQLNDSIRVDNETTVLQNTGADQILSQPADRVIFGIISAFSIFKLGDPEYLLNGRPSRGLPQRNDPVTGSTSGFPASTRATRAHSPTTTTTEMTDLRHGGGGGGSGDGVQRPAWADAGDRHTTADRFDHDVRRVFYERVQTDVEAADGKTAGAGGADADDVEAVVELVRRVPALSRQLYSHRSTLDFSEAERAALAERRAAVRDEVQDVVRRWTHFKWSEGERAALTRMGEVLGLHASHAREEDGHRYDGVRSSVAYSQAPWNYT